MDIELKVEEGVATVQERETVVESITTDALPRAQTARERVAEAFSSLINPVTTTLPSNHEIIQELVIGLKQQTRQQTYWIMLLALLFLVISIICFILMYHTSDETIRPICIMCGVFSAGASYVAFLSGILILYIHSRQPALVARGSVRYVMRIEGDQWKRFLAHFYSTSGRPSGFRGWWFSCTRNGKRYQRLLRRNYGYIVLGSVGLMVDELFCTTYDRHVVLDVKLLPMIGVKNENNDEMIIDTVMRICLCRRVYNSRSGPPTPFKIDIFLATEIPSYEIPGIVTYVALR